MLAASIAALNACAASEAPQQEPRAAHKTLTLAQGASAAIAPGLELHFDGVRDSRCPKDATCVWAGELVYNFTLSGRSQDSFSLRDMAPRQTLAPPLGLSIALANTTAVPLPVAGKAAPPYTVTVQVSQ